MGNVLELPLEGCPRHALKDCSSSDRTSDTVTVDLSRLLEGKETVESQKVLEPCARSPMLRAICVSAAHGDSESTTISVTPREVEVPEAPVPDERMARDAEATSPVKSVEEVEIQSPDQDVLRVIAAMSASNGEEVQAVLAPAELALPVVSPAAPLLEEQDLEAEEKGRCSSRSTEDEPECEACEAVSSRAPSPEAVPSPGILLTGPTLVGLHSSGRDGPRVSLRPAFDEGRLRRASQLFASMLRGEPLPRRSEPRRRSEPPRQEFRLFRGLPRLTPNTQGPRRAASADAREVLSRPLRPLNGQMPWFPSALPMRRLPRPGSLTRMPALPWARKLELDEKEADNS
ncbi:unnamed protein product [Durusdinium trenchii]|uniref:Uncharacterized protein n=1 Tax=Durusdinium trenchii TaxID=1381693 RepID=A0ABP0IBG9_9DINO